MLVLSRRPEEEIHFPNLGITVRVLQIEGRVAKIGVTAPSDVRILRGEISDQSLRQHGTAPSAVIPAHRLRNRLNAVSLAVALLQKQIDRGEINDAEVTLEKLVSELRELDHTLQKSDHAAAADVEPALCHILVVDDDENERELLAGLLRLNGCRVDTASDGCEAMEYLAKNDRPDFVLLDMSMPRCDGSETIALIRQDLSLSSLPVFAISGLSSQDTNVNIGPSGVDDWFEKPLNAKRLLSRINAGSASC